MGLEARRGSLEMITRGFAFALATEVFQQGEEIAQRLAPETVEEIEEKLAGR